MQDDIARLRAEGLAAIAGAADHGLLDKVRVRLLGRKGELTTLLRGLKDVGGDARASLGAALNELKQELSEAVAAREAALNMRSSVRVVRDLTLPGSPPAYLGTLHPLLCVLEEVCDIFYGMGYDRNEGPEVELDYYNFTALNFPFDHPARDIQDTFFLGEEILLRTQTSPVQVRTMEQVRPPLAYVFPGRVYRNENADASHSSEFYQVEGLRVNTDVSLVDLRLTVETFVASFFEGARPTRFRPHYFPFTEPSVEVDMQCVKCSGRGCSVCGQSGWLEIMGAGMVHPNVFKAAGYPEDAYTGFAFGMGIDRLAMLKYSIPDIRLFYENDLRFLQQFRGVL